MRLVYDGLNLFQSNLSHITHELGHLWRQLHKLDPDKPELPKTEHLKFPRLMATEKEKELIRLENEVIKEKNRLLWNDYHTTFANFREINERGASHIQNIVLSELMKVNSKMFEGIILRETYDHADELENVYENGKLYVRRFQGLGTLNLLVPPHDKDFYLNNKIDLHNDHNVQPIPKKR